MHSKCQSSILICGAFIQCLSPGFMAILVTFSLQPWYKNTMSWVLFENRLKAFLPMSYFNICVMWHKFNWESCNLENYSYMAVWLHFFLLFFLTDLRLQAMSGLIWSEVCLFLLSASWLVPFQISVGQPYGHLCMFSRLLLWQDSTSGW